MLTINQNLLILNLWMRGLIHVIDPWRNLTLGFEIRQISIMLIFCQAAE